MKDKNGMNHDDKGLFAENIASNSTVDIPDMKKSKGLDINEEAPILEKVTRYDGAESNDSIFRDNLEELNDEAKEILGQEYTGFKGRDAINKLLTEQQGHIKDAFNRSDIGGITLIWGDKVTGLRHIIERRAEQEVDTDKFFSDLTEVIEQGAFRKKNDRGNFEFMHNGKIAVVSPELKGGKITFLLTAFKTHSKK
jgi:hypothetical protein